MPALQAMVDAEPDADPVNSPGDHKQTIELSIKASTKAKYFGRFLETFFIKIDGTLNWQKLQLRGSTIRPPEKVPPEAAGTGV